MAASSKKRALEEEEDVSTEEDEPPRKKGKAARDEVYTPDALVKDCISMIPVIPGDVWHDGFCGKGAFLRNYPSTVLGTWTEIERSRDFFKYGQHVDWVVSNPPFSTELLNASVEHCVEICKKGFGLIMPVRALNVNRLRICEKGGFSLVKLHLFIVKSTRGSAKTKSTWPNFGHYFAVWMKNVQPQRQLLCAPPMIFGKEDKEKLIQYAVQCIPLEGKSIIMDPFFPGGYCSDLGAGTTRKCVRRSSADDFLDSEEQADWIISVFPSKGTVASLRHATKLAQIGMGVLMPSVVICPQVVRDMSALGFELVRITILHIVAYMGVWSFVVFMKRRAGIRSVFELQPKEYVVSKEDEEDAGPSGRNYCV